MAVTILHAATAVALAAATSQQAQIDALEAPWAGGDVRARIYAGNTPLRLLTLGPWVKNTGASPRRLVAGAGLADAALAAGVQTRIVFETLAGLQVFEVTAGATSSGAGVNFSAGQIRALCRPTLALEFVADGALPAFSPPAWAPGPGEIVNISLNTRADINPRSDSTLNPNAPSAAPWEVSTGWGASALSAFCGAILASDMGAHGKYLMYGATGHSTNLEFCAFLGFDLATRQWQILDAPPPTEVVTTFSAGVTPPPSRFDHTWGEWQGGSSDWPLAYRRPGYNPPMGSHTRNSFVYIPGAAAGNATGKVVVAWQPTGNQTGTGIAGAFVYDCDTGQFSRTANVRPGFGSAVAGVAYHAGQNVVIGYNRSSSTTVAELDYLDLSTMTWTRRNATAAVAIQIDSTNFVVGDLYVYVENGASSMSLRAAPVSTVKAGGSWAWASLTVSASSWPNNGGTWTVQWSRCPVNGAWYAVNHLAGSLTLWKLEKPAGVDDSDTAGLLAGTWNVTSETLTGVGLAGASYDYGRLQWSDYLNAFLWVGDLHTSAVQAIRPNGV